MSKRSKKLWRVSVEDSQYSGNNWSFLLTGISAAEVESLALKLAAKNTGADEKEPAPRPFIRQIEFIGTIDN